MEHKHPSTRVSPEWNFADQKSGDQKRRALNEREKARIWELRRGDIVQDGRFLGRIIDPVDELGNMATVEPVEYVGTEEEPRAAGDVIGMGRDIVVMFLRHQLRAANWTFADAAMGISINSLRRQAISPTITFPAPGEPHQVQQQEEAIRRLRADILICKKELLDMQFTLQDALDGLVKMKEAEREARRRIA